VLVAAYTNAVDELGIDDKTALIPSNQITQIELLGVAVGRHPHHLEFAIQHLEPEKLGDRTVKAAQGIRGIKLLEPMDLTRAAVAEPCRAILAHAVHAHDRGVAITGKVIGAGGVSQMMFNGNKADAPMIDAHFFEHVEDGSGITSKPSVAIEQRHESAVGRIPMAHGVVTAAGVEKGDRRKRVGHHLNVRWLDARLFQTIPRRQLGLEAFRMFVAVKPLFVGCGDDLAINDEGGGRVMANCAAKAKHNHGTRAPPGAHDRWRAMARSSRVIALVIRVVARRCVVPPREMDQAVNAIRIGASL
jgi:hypothetical protein